MGRASGDTTGLKVGSPEWWAEENYRRNTSTTTNTQTNTGSNNNSGSSSGSSGSSSSDTFTGWRVAGSEFAYFDNGTKQYGVALDNPDFVAEVNKNKVLAPGAGDNNWRVAAGRYLMNRASAGAATGGAATGGATTTSGAGAGDGPTGVEAYNQSLAYKTYIDTLATLIKQTGQLHTFNGLDARGMPIFTPLFNDDGSPKRPQDYYLTQAQIDKYAADIVFQKAQAASEYAAQASKLTGDTGFVYMYKATTQTGPRSLSARPTHRGSPNCRPRTRSSSSMPT